MSDSDQDGGLKQDSIITVRLPETFHLQLIEQAREQRKSLNELCVERLVPGASVVPSESKTARWQMQGSQPTA